MWKQGCFSDQGLTPATSTRTPTPKLQGGDAGLSFLPVQRTAPARNTFQLRSERQPEELTAASFTRPPPSTVGLVASWTSPVGLCIKPVGSRVLGEPNLNHPASSRTTHQRWWGRPVFRWRIFYTSGSPSIRHLWLLVPPAPD